MRHEPPHPEDQLHLITSAHSVLTVDQKTLKAPWENFQSLDKTCPKMPHKHIRAQKKYIKNNKKSRILLQACKVSEFNTHTHLPLNLLRGHDEMDPIYSTRLVKYPEHNNHSPRYKRTHMCKQIHLFSLSQSYAPVESLMLWLTAFFIAGIEWRWGSHDLCPANRAYLQVKL